ncbi:MAG TPA: 3-oxoadipate CoA-transferase, partial [Cupriavidus sp.]|nr:3-oxoadipate CoA-transferase [Cupriavidus sp.]
MPRLSRAQMARIVAHDIPDGSVVNLGIGMPTLVSDQL